MASTVAQTHAFASIAAARAAIASRSTTASALLDACLASAGSPANACTYVAPPRAAPARAAAAAADAAAAAGAPVPRLAGLAVSVKDLFDVAGEVTAAGSTALAGGPPAAADAPAVARLRAAGAALLGRTNMTEFAYSGVGINPHFGTPVNFGALAVEGAGAPARVPGGSTSGGAASVASGAAWAALGTDTGGSLRIPAALCGLVGFKPTARSVPGGGLVPLAPSLDSVGAITRCVADAAELHSILRGDDAPRAAALGGGAPRALGRWRFGVPTTLVLDGLEPPVADAFARALAALRAAGASVEETPLPPLAEVAAANLQGGIASTEAFAWHAPLLARAGDAYDPRVSKRIRLGEGKSAAEYIRLVAARAAWRADMRAAMAGFDAMLSPTVPAVAPPLAPLLESDDAFFATNARLLRNPSVVSLLDGCGLSVPCGPRGGLPVGLHVWSAGGDDDAVLEAGLAIERALSDAGLGSRVE